MAGRGQVLGRFERVRRRARPLSDSEWFGFYAGLGLLLFAVGLFVQGMAPGWLRLGPSRAFSCRLVRWQKRWQPRFDLFLLALLIVIVVAYIAWPR